MTIASTTNKVPYNGAGSVGPFSITFKFAKNADIVATKVSTAGVESTLTLTTHYTLTGAGDPSGGALTLVTALASGEKLIIKRSPAIVQETEYVENAAFPAESHEAALDLLTMIAQDNAEKINRAVLVPISGTTSPEDLLEELATDVATAEAAATTATTQAGLAATAKTGAETAQGLAEDARDAAIAARDAIPAAEDILTTQDIGDTVQGYDADTMKSDVVTARTRAHRFTPAAVTAASGGALAIDCDLHEECTITLAETTTTVGAASNQAAGKYVVIIITGTTGKALAWNTNWQEDGAACTIAAPANGVTDMHCFRSNGTNMKHIGSKLAV